MLDEKVVHDKSSLRPYSHLSKIQNENVDHLGSTFKTPSLDESRSPDLDLFSDQEEYPEEEVAENNGRNYGTIHEKNSN
ncbi:hypothetical protein Tco_0424323 [Tanacetum coccineum]